MRRPVGAHGRLMEAYLDASSGHRALGTGKRIAEFPHRPEGLRGSEFAVLVPMAFRLQR
jgi:hypothetical protein